jgi:thiol-disulfide isomerase/thioredoxin
MAIVITKRQRRSVVGAALAVLILAVVTTSNVGGDDGVQDAGSVENGVAVESELPSQGFELFDGASATFQDFEGTPLVINFWASWCPACVSELPEFQAVHEQRSDKVTFIGIANADIRPAAVGLAEEVGLTYSLADDPEGDLFREFGLIAMPSTLFVSPDGEILEVFAGQLNESALNDRIDTLIADS